MVVLVLAVVIFGGGAEEVVDDPVDENGGNAGKTFAVYNLPRFQAEGQATMNKDFINLNGGILRCDDTKSLIDEIVAADQFSVELIITPGNASQSGPARILTFSKTYAARNFTIAQEKDTYEVRVRTSTALSGLRPRFVTEAVVTPNKAQHLLFVREKDHHVLYVNGAEAVREKVYGHIGNWDDSFPLLLGNDIKKAAPWYGTIHQLNFMTKELNANQAKEHYETWANKN